MSNLRKALEIILQKEEFTQDIKKIFFNEAVFDALSEAMDAHIGENRVDIARALWFVAGRLGLLGELEPAECTNCGEKTNAQKIIAHAEVALRFSLVMKKN